MIEILPGMKLPRPLVEYAVELFLAALDKADGDPDKEDETIEANGDEDDGSYCSG